MVKGPKVDFELKFEFSQNHRVGAKSQSEGTSGLALRVGPLPQTRIDMNCKTDRRL